MTKSPQLTIDRSALARVLGVSVRQIGVLESSGHIVPSVRGRGGRASRYDLTEVVPAYITYLQGDSSQRPRDRRDTAAAELLELRVLRERAELVPRDAVILQGQSYTKAWTSKVRGLPRRLTNAGVIERSAEPAARELIRDVLTEISTWRVLDDLPSV